MKIMLVSPEMVPYAKTGGLADVVGALPRLLADMGHEVFVIMPCYRGIKERFNPRYSGVSVDIMIHEGDSYIKRTANILYYDQDKRVKVYFVDKNYYFNRDFLYGPSDDAYGDNAARFYFFCTAALSFLKQSGLKPDILHCHDWQAALVPILLKTKLADDPFYQDLKTILTIHNLRFQGQFWRWDMNLFDIDWAFFTPQYLEFYDHINLLKGGIVFSDVITTVSKKYAEEIQTPEFGYSLEGVLRERSSALHGILNGIDYSVWNPATDRLLPANYTISDTSGKGKCKVELQTIFGLPLNPQVPVLACVSRLEEQKVELIAAAAEEILARNVQFILLGAGKHRFEERFKDIARRYPGKAGIRIEFNDRLAHQIEAGADIFLMPSSYEPCGLNQMISLKYGTIPIVTATGGLDDTVLEFNPETRAGNGFKFKEYQTQAMLEALDRALGLYARPEIWEKITANAMSADFSFNSAAKQYENLYKILKGY